MGRPLLAALFLWTAIDGAVARVRAAEDLLGVLVPSRGAEHLRRALALAHAVPGAGGAQRERRVGAALSLALRQVAIAERLRRAAPLALLIAVPVGLARHDRGRN